MGYKSGEVIGVGRIRIERLQIWERVIQWLIVEKNV